MEISSIWVFEVENSREAKDTCRIKEVEESIVGFETM